MSAPRCARGLHVLDPDVPGCPPCGDRLDRIAADGSQKLPIRILPALRAERAAGRLPAAATRVLAAWVCHLRGLGAPVSDARADEVVPLAAGPLGVAVPRVLGWLDQDLGADADVAAIVIGQSEQLALGRLPQLTSPQNPVGGVTGNPLRFR